MTTTQAPNGSLIVAQHGRAVRLGASLNEVWTVPLGYPSCVDASRSGRMVALSDWQDGLIAHLA